jgi:hypothetical protein
MFVKIKKSEKEIEKTVCDAAENKGFLCFKFSSPGNKGVPDRLFIKNNEFFFIEFKAPGKKLTVLQGEIFKILKKENVRCYTVDNVEMGLEILEYELR